jgi:hypothetical protein
MWCESTILTGVDGVRAVALLPSAIEVLLGPSRQATKATWTLLYRGTRDGFAASDFHRTCDNQGATITVVKSTRGYVFGGVTGMPWMAAGRWVETTAAFLYGIRTNGSPYSAVLFNATHNTGAAMYDHPAFGPTFGGVPDAANPPHSHGSSHGLRVVINSNSLGDAHDLFIASDADSNLDSVANPGLTYTGNGIDQTVRTAQRYFAGSNNFQLAEIEVFTIVPPSPWDSSEILVGNDATRASDFLPAKIEAVLGRRFPAAKSSWKLLYRGSRDGFAASDFHNRCDNQGATITVVKSASGFVFGGVTGVAWTSKGGNVNTTDVFLYGIRTHRSLSAPVIFLPTQNTENAMYDDEVSGPHFGTGLDLNFSPNGRAENTFGTANLGHVYTGNGIFNVSRSTGATYEASTFMTKLLQFQVADVEVFTIGQPSTLPPPVAPQPPSPVAPQPPSPVAPQPPSPPQTLRPPPTSPWSTSHILAGDDGARAANFLPAHIEQVVGPTFTAGTTTWKLLYRGTRDGFGAADFHTNCDNKGATVTVAKSSCGYIFGGVTGLAWSSAGGHVSTNTAFLYGIRTHASPDVATIYKAYRSTDKSMWDARTSGPSFGGGADLHIHTNTDADAGDVVTSYSSLGDTYTSASTDVNTLNGTNTFGVFTGAFYFDVAEVEVFQLVAPTTPVRSCGAPRVHDTDSTNWAANAGAGDCVRIVDEGSGPEWLATPCGDESGYICELPLPPQQSPPDVVDPKSAAAVQPRNEGGQVATAGGCGAGVRGVGKSTQTSATTMSEMPTTTTGTLADSGNSGDGSDGLFAGGVAVGLVSALVVAVAIFAAKQRQAIQQQRQRQQRQHVVTRTATEEVVIDSLFGQSASGAQAMEASGVAEMPVVSASHDQLDSNTSFPHLPSLGGSSSGDGNRLAFDATRSERSATHTHCTSSVDGISKAPYSALIRNSGICIENSIGSGSGGKGGPVYATPISNEKPQLDQNGYVYDTTQNRSGGDGTTGNGGPAYATPANGDAEYVEVNVALNLYGSDDGPAYAILSSADPGYVNPSQVRSASADAISSEYC